jgi:hypothetical protein
MEPGGFCILNFIYNRRSTGTSQQQQDIGFPASLGNPDEGERGSGMIPNVIPG